MVQEEKFGEKDFQTIIGNLLRYGVWISLSVAFIGGIVYLIHNGSQIEDYSVFKENDRNIFEVIATIYNGAIQGNGESLIFTGIIFFKKQEFFYKNDLFNSFFITFIKRKSKTISNNALIEILNTTFLEELV